MRALTDDETRRDPDHASWLLRKLRGSDGVAGHMQQWNKPSTASPTQRFNRPAGRNPTHTCYQLSFEDDRH